jgi:hypothetical protein
MPDADLRRHDVRGKPRAAMTMAASHARRSNSARNRWQAVRRIARLGLPRKTRAMLASAIARWIVAVPLAVAAFMLAFLLARTIALRLHAAPIGIAASGAIATIAAGVVGVAIVPPSTRRTARRVFGGVPVALAISPLLHALAGHVPRPPCIFAVAGMLCAGYIVVKAFRRQPAIA